MYYPANHHRHQDRYPPRAYPAEFLCIPEQAIYDEDSDRTLLDVISGTRVTDPEELIISREEFNDIEEKMGEILSSLEWKVLMYYLEGKSYQEIAGDLNRHVKSIDNALQRVKRKLERYLESREAADR